MRIGEDIVLIANFPVIIFLKPSHVLLCEKSSMFVINCDVNWRT